MDVVRCIEALIEDRSLQLGDRIATKSELRASSGAAPATVNEAIKLLQDRGRVSMKPGPSGGLFVAQADPGVQLGRFLVAVGKDGSRITDAIALRDFLETLVVEEAAGHRTEKDVSDLRSCLVQMEAARDDTRRLLDAIWALHDRIAAITPNVILKATYCGLTQFIRENVTGLPQAKRAGGESNEDRIRVHRVIVNVIESGDVAKVPAAVKLHNEGFEAGHSG